MTTLPTPGQAILIRVAADHSYGEWNGPCNRDTGDFVYVPIPQSSPNAQGMVREYLPLVSPALGAFSARNAVEIVLPEHLRGQHMHLDPDFDHLTYGDVERRGRKLLSFRENDWVVFYAGLRPIHGGSLVYALIGLLVIDKMRRVAEIPTTEYDRNAHTRYLHREDSNIVVTGKPGLSGRFMRCLDIGEFRDRSYRVRQDLLDAWGDLTVNNGWIQRSASPPLFRDPARFAQWLKDQHPVMIAANN